MWTFWYKSKYQCVCFLPAHLSLQSSRKGLGKWRECLWPTFWLRSLNSFSKFGEFWNLLWQQLLSLYVCFCSAVNLRNGLFCFEIKALFKGWRGKFLKILLQHHGWRVVNLWGCIGPFANIELIIQFSLNMLRATVRGGGDGAGSIHDKVVAIPHAVSWKVWMTLLKIAEQFLSPINKWRHDEHFEKRKNEGNPIPKFET